LRCDESCGGSGWRHTPDAWQWNALVVLGATAFVAGGALVFFVWRGRRLYAAASVAVGLCAVLVLASAFSPEWPSHFDRRSPGELLLALVGVAAPLAAVLFARPPRRDETG
jgi:peptidoglycan/LPS O-acetylase OafA/YrhL